ncbi:hypothetical protein SKAU_G00160590 [Synaphobranchus kaupii]|uniref:Uncharacterized protein n=1 Tax=Synaphobranchus kaupii TaxID=118154 RepID=A0A9Q1IXL7_SYNKA|nr:hypothetical protein SKAU_G00160590 [Synaphobranchus kaupii]
MRNLQQRCPWYSAAMAHGGLSHPLLQCQVSEEQQRGAELRNSNPRPGHSCNKPPISHYFTRGFLRGHEDGARRHVLRTPISAAVATCTPRSLPDSNRSLLFLPACHSRCGAPPAGIWPSQSEPSLRLPPPPQAV